MKRLRPGFLAAFAIPAIILVLLATTVGASATGSGTSGAVPGATEPGASAPSDPDRPVSSRGSQVKLPDLTGMTVAKAERRLHHLGLRSEAGTILTRRHVGADLLRRGGRRSETVTAQAPAAGWFAAKGDSVALGTAGDSGPMKVAALEEVTWRRTKFARGVLTLNGLSVTPLGGGFCGVVDHASVEGAGKTRRLRVWVARFKIPPFVRCMPVRRARMVPGRGWNQATVGWPTPLEEIRPGLPDAFPVPFERAVLQPDRRRVLVTYWHGACDALTGAEFERVAARRIKVKLLFGRTGPADMACPAIAVGGVTVVKLPWRVGPRTRFVAARRAAGGT